MFLQYVPSGSTENSSLESKSPSYSVVIVVVLVPWKGNDNYPSVRLQPENPILRC